MKEIDFLNIDYLAHGDYLQKQVHEVILRSQVFVSLAKFHPTLVGTIPIGIAIDGSDLDIICQADDLDEFAEVVSLNYSDFSSFKIVNKLIDSIPSCIVNFDFGCFQFELFAQNCLVKQQNGFRHMIIEHEILRSKGNDFRENVIELKKSGIKTEPAFAQLLGIEGNPYIELLNYK